MLIDKNNPKRYGYPSRIYLDPKDVSDKYDGYPPINKGGMYLHISMPYINRF